MTRKECLDAAAACVLRDRASQYGGPEDNFGRIARLWTAYTGTVLDGIDVAMMMSLLKVARIRNNKSYEDGYIDLAGYAACGAELAGAENARENATRRAGEEYKKLRAKAEGGCCQNGNDQPKFKPGDRVQYRVELPSVSDWIWCDATYLRPAFSWQKDGEHIVSSDDLGPVTVKDKDIRPAPEAEGCEDLVFDEARMRESMPGIVPQDGPSDMDKPRHLLLHKPTGEELAEMAEEDAHE